MKSAPVKIILVFLFLFFLSYPTFSQGTIKIDVKERVKNGDKIIFKAWKSYDTKTIDSLPGFKSNNLTPSKYGFFKSIQGNATGFFHTQKIGGRWWVVDPEGNAGINILINSFQKGPSDKNKYAYNQLFNNGDEWMERSIEMFRKYGFNGAGSWSDIDAIRIYNKTARKPFPYTIMLNWMSGYGKHRGGTYQLAGHTGYPNQCIFVFDKGFEEYCDKKAADLLHYVKDPNLIGYFSDNELPFSKSNLKGYLKLPQDDPGFKAATNWLKEKGVAANKLTDKHLEDFAGFVAEKYYSVVSNAIRKNDPNHMYLGSRLYASSPHIQSVLATCGKYVDIITINYYNNWEAKDIHLENWEKWTDKPFQVTEFYTKAEDSGLPNTAGAGWTVRTQKDRGYAYQHFCMSLLKASNCVGWHWFKYMDNDPTYDKAEPSNTDSNKGLFDNDYKPYKDMLEKMEVLNNSYIDLITFFKNNN